MNSVWFQSVGISFASGFNIEQDNQCAYDYVNVMGDGGANKHGKSAIENCCILIINKPVHTNCRVCESFLPGTS